MVDESSFDWRVYLARNISLQDHIFTEKAARAHWERVGSSNNAIFTLGEKEVFDTERYFMEYFEDLPENTITDNMIVDGSLVTYWIQTGILRGNRMHIFTFPEELPLNFDWRIYLARNLDLQKAKIYTRESAIKHWIDHGKREQRPYTDDHQQLKYARKFNLLYYAEEFPEVKPIFEKKEGWSHLLHYWSTVGAQKGHILHSVYSMIKFRNYGYNYMACDTKINPQTSIALMVHMLQHEMWKEFAGYISKIMKLPCRITLFVNLVSNYNSDEANTEMRRVILEAYPNCIVTISDNHGMDIGGFATQMQYIRDHQLHFDLVLKLQSKSLKLFRELLIVPLIEQAAEIVTVMQSNPEIGMVGCDKFCVPIDHRDDNELTNLCKRYEIEPTEYISTIDETKKTFVDYEYLLEYEFDLLFEEDGPNTNASNRKFPWSYWNCYDKPRYIEKLSNPSTTEILLGNHFRVTNKEMIVHEAPHKVKFIAGTVFWCRFEILQNIHDWKDVYKTFSYGRVENITVEHPEHAWERMFGLLAAHSRKQVLGVYDLNRYIAPSSMFNGKKRLCIMAAHCDRLVDNAFLDYVGELQRHFTDVIIMASGNAVKRSRYLLKQKYPTIKYTIVENKGYDFYKWYMACQEFDPRDYAEVAMVNDSCTMIGKLENSINEMRSKKLDMWGLIDSYQYADRNEIYNRYHICSFFRVYSGRGLYFFKKFVEHNNIFERGYQDIDTLRTQIINFYEIAMCEFFINSGLYIESFFKTSILAKNANYEFTDISMMHRFEVLRNAGFPLMKRKLINTLPDTNQPD